MRSRLFKIDGPTKDGGASVSVVIAAALFCVPAAAQQRQPQTPLQTPQQPIPTGATVSFLTAQGFEIKAATMSSDFALVFLQKGKDVYRCNVPTGVIALRAPKPSVPCSPIE